jgi:exodeoxyribonuclease VII small subunit
LDAQQLTFEECLRRLQQTIERLERGGLPLETALDLFEQSMRLSTDCQKILERAELRLSRLVEEYGLSSERN